MKKYIPFILIVIITFASCEKDDICVEETTPNLIIRFYDDTNNSETKTVGRLSVWAEGKDQLYSNQSLDSIVIPLDPNTSSTTYHFQAGTVDDVISFGYKGNNIFVSRSCGYKTTFEELSIANNSSNWIKDLIINNSTIENETAAHITIFH